MRFCTLKYCLCAFLCLTIYSSFAQIPLLERSISLKINNEKVVNALEIIAKEGGFSFSYNSEIIEINTRVDMVIANKPVREILNQIFKGTIKYKIRGQYIILRKNEQINRRNNRIISGYILDKQSEKPLPNVSIYDRKSLSSAISNQYGFYRIKLFTSELPIYLTISKPDYYQQKVEIKSFQTTNQNIELFPIQREIVFLPTVEDNSMEQMDSLKKLSPLLDIPLLNTTPIPPQFPDITDENLFPTSPIIDSTLYENRWDKFKKKLGKVLVSRSQRINAQNVKDSLSRNFQLSLLPFLGTNRLLSGSIKNDYSINILMGYSGGVRKLEVGGILNGVRRDVEGLQVAGGINIVGGNVSGVQVSSILNIAGHLQKGVQITPMLNVTIKESNGWQIGMLNFAHRVLKGGKQIGLINIADSTDTTPLGFLSFVGGGSGYKRLELSVDENETASFTFKTGVSKFYNVLAIHYNFIRKQEIFGLGYGIGRAFKLRNAWMFNTDLTASALVEYDDFSPNLATLWELDLSFEKQIAKNTAITFGPSCKYLTINEYNVSNWKDKPFNRMPSYRPLSATNNSTLWIGFQMGIRIRSK